MRKYGKVLQTPAPTSKPMGSPRRDGLPPISGTTQLQQQGAGGDGSILPSLTHRTQQPKGTAPIFQAKGPVPNFFTRNTGVAAGGGPARDPGSTGGRLDDVYSEQQALPPISKRPPEPYRKGPSEPLPPLPLSRRASAADADDGIAAPSSLAAYAQPPPPGGPSDAAWTTTPPRTEARQAPAGGSILQTPLPQLRSSASMDGAKSAAAAQQPRASPRASPRTSHPGVGAVGSPTGPYRNRPMRDLQLELSVLKAIKSRDDALERIRIASEKLDSGFGGVAPVVLSPVDPMVRLFYRLVGTLRSRTIEVVEAIASWRRKVSPDEPFVYYGVDYLANIGPDVAFLDALPFLRSRLTFTKAAEDPFLCEVTPDGIPIEEATTCDLRRGGHRFSSEALRLRMARKALAKYCGRPQASMSAIVEDESSMGLAGDASLSHVAAMAAIAASHTHHLPALSPAAYGDDGDDGYATAADAAPTVHPDSAAAAAAAAAVVAAGRGGDDDDAVLSASDSVMLGTVDGNTPTASATASAAPTAEELAPAGDADGDDDDGKLVPDQDHKHAPEAAEAAAPLEAEAHSASGHGDATVTILMDDDLAADNDFIDFAISAMVASLEEPHVSHYEPFGFTVAGWEIDQSLEQIVDTLQAVPAAALSAADNAASADPGVVEPDLLPPPASEDGDGKQDELAAAALLLPLQAEASSAGPAASTPVPESPVHVHLRLNARGVELRLSMNGQPTAMFSAPYPQGYQPSPRVSEAGGVGVGGEASSSDLPINVHLRPHSRGVDVSVALEDETAVVASYRGPPGYMPPMGTIAEAEASGPIEEHGAGGSMEGGAALPSPVRVHLRPHSRGVNLELSVDEAAAAGAAAPYALAMPGVEEAVPAEASAALTMDDEADVELGSPVHVHLRPHSRGVDVSLSMADEAAAMAADDQLEPIPEAEASEAEPEAAPAEPGAAGEEGAEEEAEAPLDPPVPAQVRPASSGGPEDATLGVAMAAGAPPPLAAAPAGQEEEEARVGAVEDLGATATPIQGSLSARGNRARVRSARGSRAASTTGDGQ